ncbi:hypothetical protein [Calycomorphotria hydatis]|uniref:Uncharacterized protein n=1 Tax=Calycomorphotria hydatis TaxID=2528027 RepID=A0A517T7L7_9PLAN|nr:hypothetical protein [Calycomorphotria hydatis]QDT64372.1 hypothetical protein V22_16060 [Calycomorphotria hydatis]
MKLINLPAQTIEQQRSLFKDYWVFSGPASNMTFLEWAKGGEEVDVIDLSSLEKINNGVVSLDHWNLLSSDEAMGFDPFSNEHPVLCSIQNISSVVLSITGLSQRLSNHLIIPARRDFILIEKSMNVEFNDDFSDKLKADESSDSAGMKYVFLDDFENEDAAASFLVPLNGNIQPGSVNVIILAEEKYAKGCVGAKLSRTITKGRKSCEIQVGRCFLSD